MHTLPLQQAHRCSASQTAVGLELIMAPNMAGPPPLAQVCLALTDHGKDLWLGLLQDVHSVLWGVFRVSSVLLFVDTKSAAQHQSAWWTSCPCHMPATIPLFSWGTAAAPEYAFSCKLSADVHISRAGLADFSPYRSRKAESACLLQAGMCQAGVVGERVAHKGELMGVLPKAGNQEKALQKYWVLKEGQWGHFGSL